jgi:DNA-directed RNA polymerase specialized sigma24 family protein
MACDDEEARESRGPWDAVAEDPTPSQAAMLGETLEQLMRGFNDVERTIISLRLQEFTVPEIGVRVQRSDRTVRRVLERARLCLQRLEEGEDRR